MQLLLISEHPLVRDALERLLRATYPAADLSVAASYEKAPMAAGRQPPDMTVVTLFCRSAVTQPNLSDLVAIAAPGRVVVFGECGLGGGARQALEAGAHGYIPATTRAELVTAAIALVAAGGTYFPQTPAFNEGANGSRGHAMAGRLSQRQLAVFHALKEGKSNKVIARDLMISVATVKQHVQAILKQSGARNRTEAVARLTQPHGPPEPGEYLLSGRTGAARSPDAG